MNRNVWEGKVSAAPSFFMEAQHGFQKVIDNYYG